jgi:predicted ATPase/class 3 adenylate cyclase
MGLPPGTVTFLFTDVEGSTRLLHELGDTAYERALRDHRSTIRAAFEAHGGVEVDTQGDAFFVAFERARDALAAAAALTAALDGGPIRVRVGIHTGEPLVSDGGYVGLDVHRAARIAAVGHGGQVLVSQTTRDLVPDVDLHDLGLHRLKDLASQERIFQLGVGEFPALKSLNRTNLPVAAGPLVGRDRELEQLTQLIRGGARLVTLTGPGGSGKTRLGLQVAAELVEEHADGVFFVGLAALTDSRAVPSAVATSLGLPTDTDVLQQLAARRALIVLDNAEHLDVAELVAELLIVSPDVHVLVTSRSPLHLSAEREFVVEPLATDGAVELFVARAAAVGERIEPDGTVAAICARLDCLPLAVELAAVRTKLLSPEALLGRLEHALPILTGGPRDAPERQRTLRATVEWSYNLLDTDARVLFRRLSVFRGTFAADAAAAVARAELDDLATLVDQSLLKHVGGDRFLLLETLREFAIEQLSDAEAEEAAEAHTAYFLSVIELEAPRLESPELSAARARLLEDVANLRATLDRLHDDVRLADAVNGLWRFWNAAGLLRDGERYATLGLEIGAELPDGVRIDLLRNAFWSRATRGHWEEARPIAAERLRLARALGEPAHVIAALMSSAVAFDSSGDFEAARAHGSEAVAVARELGEPARIAIAVGNLAAAEQRGGDDAAAERLLSEEIEIRRGLGDPNLTAAALGNLGILHAYADRPDAARPCLREALPTLFESNPMGFGWALAAMALVAWSHGDGVTAARLLARSESFHREIGYSHTDKAMAEHYVKTQPLRDARSDPAVDEAWHEGEAMPLEAALAEALTV